MRKPDVLIYLPSINTDLELRWLDRRLYNIYEKVVNPNRIVVVTEPSSIIDLRGKV